MAEEDIHTKLVFSMKIYIFIHLDIIVCFQDKPLLWLSGNSKINYHNLHFCNSKLYTEKTPGS